MLAPYSKPPQVAILLASRQSDLHQKQTKMDSPRKPKSLSTNLFFLVLLLSTNLLTLFLSSTFYSSSFCYLHPISSTFTQNSSSSVADSDATENPDTQLDLPSEFLAFTSGQALPYGFNTNFDSDTFYPPVGQACKIGRAHV